MHLDIEAFERDGYLVVRDIWQDRELDDLQDELAALGRLVVGPGFSVTAMQDYTMSAEQQSLFYDRLKYLPALSRLSGSKAVMRLCRDLGIGHPSLMGCCNMRLDRPHDARHLFEWHQDSVYLLGSFNAVTLWIPLQDVDLGKGTIEVLPGSHRRGIYPFRKISDKAVAPHVPMLQRDLSLDVAVEGRPQAIVAGGGDVVVFRQMLLHRSTANLSDQIRWTAQLRITDLDDAEHRRQGFPTGDRRNIFYVDYPNHDACTRRAQEQARAAARKEQA
jgi:ectoine hydroxylase-related dioxygenase (phytanoyl-CoA dioxygenase family)